MANALEPDIIVLTGDFVSDKAETVTELGTVLADFKAKHGVFGCLGNHDGWKGPGTVMRVLDKAGIRMLKNEGETLREGGVPIFVGGVDSVWAGQANPVKALKNKQDDEVGILLCHEPDVFPSYANGGPFSLMVSGHTHGGQVRCPGIGAPILPRWGKNFPYGLFERNGAALHVNPGIGTVQHHVRLFCRPEVSGLTLRQKV